MRPILLCSCLLLGGCALLEPTAQPALQTDLLQLRQQQEDLAQRLQQLEVSLAQIDLRMRDQENLVAQLRSTPGAQMVTPGGEMAVISPTVAAPKPTTGALLPANELYMQAFADYTGGQYRQAAAGFESFLEHYGDNPYAANAQFWLGECFYGLQQYPRAIQEYQKTVERYPQGGKTPEALLKMAAALRETNQSGLARDVLRTLQQQYPDSAAAQRARLGQ